MSELSSGNYHLPGWSINSSPGPELTPMVKKLEWIDIARLAVFSMLFKLPSLKVP
jgi:hypothetical protein